MVALYLLEDKNVFNIFVDSRYFGKVIKIKDNWTCCPEQNIQDINKTILERVDRVLRILNHA
jgi:hypothetical protein